MDFDNDGKPDVLTGSYSPGELYLFRQQADGQFAAGETLKDSKNSPIKQTAAVPYAIDWDGDGDLDLLVGDIKGKVFLVPNEGTREKPGFGQAQELQAGGKSIQVPHGDAGPCVADWDGDGKADLLVGAGNGSVLWHRNIGTKEKPQLEAPVKLVQLPKGSIRVKICVFDWNGDGRLDLLVGDFASEGNSRHGWVWLYLRKSDAAPKTAQASQ